MRQDASYELAAWITGDISPHQPMNTAESGNKMGAFHGHAIEAEISEIGICGGTRMASEETGLQTPGGDR